MLDGMSSRARGLIWALVCSPIIGWFALWYGTHFRRGELSVVRSCVVLAVLPAVVASGGNALLGRGFGAVVRAGILAAAVCGLGLLLMALIFFLIVPPEFFT